MRFPAETPDKNEIYSPQNIHKSLFKKNNDLITLPYYRHISNKRFLVYLLVDHAIIKLSAKFMVFLIDKKYHLRIAADIIRVKYL